jgi:hypothetical protein
MLLGAQLKVQGPGFNLWYHKGKEEKKGGREGVREGRREGGRCNFRQRNRVILRGRYSIDNCTCFLNKLKGKKGMWWGADALD